MEITSVGKAVSEPQDEHFPLLSTPRSLSSQALAIQSTSTLHAPTNSSQTNIIENSKPERTYMYKEQNASSAFSPTGNRITEQGTILLLSVRYKETFARRRNCFPVHRVHINFLHYNQQLSSCTRYSQVCLHPLSYTRDYDYSSALQLPLPK